MMLHNKVREMRAGEELEVLASDPSTTRDIPKFCAFLGHTLVAQETLADGQEYRYRIRKGG